MPDTEHVEYSDPFLKVGRQGTAAAPAPPRPDPERIWPYVPGLHRSDIEREFGPGGEQLVRALEEILA